MNHIPHLRYHLVYTTSYVACYCLYMRQMILNAGYLDRKEERKKAATTTAKNNLKPIVK